MSRRSAIRAGMWYSNIPQTLSQDLEIFLEAVQATHTPARAIIAPHASLCFSGQCAAFAYKQVDPLVVKRVFILGPSHNQPLTTCALTTAQRYETPLADLFVDAETNLELETTGAFTHIDLTTDQFEHSVEMQLPYIAKVMENHDFTIVPILVGSLSSEQLETYGGIFCKYLADPQNLFVVSSDFCHWGMKFNYTQFDRQSEKRIHQQIEDLDGLGLQAIESLDPDAFLEYMKKYKNTICGRNPIFVLLHTVQEMLKRGLAVEANLKFLKYDQSFKSLSLEHSSVSYAAAAMIVM